MCGSEEHLQTRVVLQTSSKPAVPLFDPLDAGQVRGPDPRQASGTKNTKGVTEQKCPLVAYKQNHQNQFPKLALTLRSTSSSLGGAGT